MDIAEIEGGSIGTDLARRDFTVNAVALPLDGGPVLDPFGGLEDLARRRLRCVREENLREDPLRPLRAARFLATHALVPDRATFGAARRAAPDWPVSPPSASPRRCRSFSPVPAPFRRCAGRLARGFSPPRSASSCPRRARRASPAPSRSSTIPPRSAFPRRGAASCVWRGWRSGWASPKRRLDGGSQERRWSRRETDAAARLTTLAATAKATAARSDAWRWVVAAGPLATDGAHLAARVGAAGRRRAPRLSRLAKAPRRRLAVSGSDVMGWLSLPPGPAVGALLAELEVAAASGIVRNRREARHWLTGQVRNGLSPAIIQTH